MKALTVKQQTVVVAGLAGRWKRCPYCGATGGWEVGEHRLLPVAARQPGPGVNVAHVVVAATCRACAAVGFVDPTMVFAPGVA